LDKKEFPGKKTFAKADPDKDGTIDKDEYLALLARLLK
jgi:Ca2+-binding EF-hand superfamily protein